jgi:hypothetical protein
MGQLIKKQNGVKAAVKQGYIFDRLYGHSCVQQIKKEYPYHIRYDHRNGIAITLPPGRVGHYDGENYRYHDHLQGQRK